jgi:3-hydroxyacyl-CoA dehydrogenase/enoyl-CoA hydratase/3-hydroxybutyryl-CoA epimerase
MIAPQATDTKNWSFHTDLEKVGWLTINSPGPVNTLSREAIMELETLVARFEDLANSGELVGVVLLSGKDSGFIAGADISEFDAMSDFSVLLPWRWAGAGARLPLPHRRQ